MDRVADFLIASMDLVESHSRRILQAGLDATRSAGLSLAFLGLIFVGVGFLVTALFLFLAILIGATAAALVTGLILGSVGVVGFVLVRSLKR